MENEIGLTGSYSGPKRREPRLCSVEDCGRWHYSRGLCRNHYEHFRKHGSPLIVVHNRDRRHVKLSDDKVAEVRKMRENGLTQKAVAQHFGVERSTISKVDVGKNWVGERRGGHGR